MLLTFIGLVIWGILLHKKKRIEILWIIGMLTSEPRTNWEEAKTTNASKWAPLFSSLVQCSSHTFTLIIYTNWCVLLFRVMQCYNFQPMQSHLCSIMSKQLIELPLGKMNSLARCYLHCVTPNSNTHLLEISV